MALSIDPLTSIISVAKVNGEAGMYLVQSSPSEIWNCELNEFRLALKDWEDSPEGIVQLKTNTHNTEVSLSGLTYARVIEILPPYTITFEDGQYAINLVGANSNVAEKTNVNQVSIRPQNSAGLISTPSVEYSSFNGGVIIDVNSGNSGTLFPTGTEQRKVNNMADALLIASFRGFSKIYIHSDLTIGAGTNLTGFTLEGKSHTDIQVVIEAAAVVENLTIFNCDVSGVMDGDINITGCIVSDMDYVNGHIHASGLQGTITLGGNDKAVFVNCYTTDQDNFVVIDMGGSGQSLSLPNYAGLATIANLSDNDQEVGIGLNAGQVTIDSTVTAGTIIVAGTGLLTDNSTGTATVNSDGLMNRELIHKATWRVIYVNDTIGVSGTAFPIGTLNNPVDNIADAKLIAIENDIVVLDLEGSFTLESAFENYQFVCHNITQATIDLNGQSVAGSTFDTLTIEGEQNDRIQVNNCQINSVTNLHGSYDNCILVGSFTILAGGNFQGDRLSAPGATYIDMNGNSSISMANSNGIFVITNCTDPTNVLSITGAYLATLHSTCTAGLAYIGGIGSLTDNSVGMTVIDKTLPQATWSYDRDA